MISEFEKIKWNGFRPKFIRTSFGDKYRDELYVYNGNRLIKRVYSWHSCGSYTENQSKNNLAKRFLYEP